MAVKFYRCSHCGNIIYNYFRESTTAGMSSLLANAGIFGKVNVPKYLFLLSKNVSARINFGITLIVLFVFIICDNIRLHIGFLALIYPIICLIIFNIGVGLILSALYMFFRDISYLYNIFTLLLMYMSAIFYTVESMSALVQKILMFNPIFCYIKY